MFIIFLQRADAAILTPPYFNLVSNKPITATATCGEGTENGIEQYCKLTSSTDSERETVSGTIQV